ncbi:glutathione S-transferase, partial [Leucogyrophana mollusca]
MVLKLYGFSTSTCTLRVAVTLSEKNVPFEFHHIDLVGGAHKQPNFTAFQPFGQVPYIDDDGFILYESRAIARYIAAKYASQGTQNLLPSEPKANALFEQAASIETSNFDPFASGLAWELKFTKMYGGKTDEARVVTLRSTLSAKLDAYEAILAKQKYLAGNEVTLADLFHLPYGSVILGIGVDEFTSRPSVARWWNDITSRPSWQAVKNGV